MMRSRRMKAGFTLMELITVLAVLGVVSSIGVGAFFNVTGAWRETRLRMEMGDRAQHAFGRIEADIQRVASSLRTGHAVQGYDMLNEENRYERYRLEDDRLVLPLVQKRLDGRTERLSVQYLINRENGQLSLTRTLGVLGASAPAGASEPIIEGALTFDLEYLDAGKWKDSWSESYNPEAIRVSMTICQPSNRAEQTARSAVFPIHVK